MTALLATSASPLAHSRSGSEVSVSVSATTSSGCLKAPTRFLPAGRSTPVLPPTEESTWASSVVGNLHEVHSTQVRCRGESREIADDPTAERHHEVASVEAQMGERLQKLARDQPALACFAGLD